MLQKLLDHGRTGNARTFDFEWHDFNDGPDLFFQIDRKQRIIWLNSTFPLLPPEALAMQKAGCESARLARH